MCQEATHAAICLGTESSARGAWYSTRNLSVFLRNNAACVRKVVKGKSGQGARAAVFQYADSLEDDHPLKLHLEGKLYKPDKAERPAQLSTKRKNARCGKPVCQTREKQLERKEYTEVSKKHQRLKRGVDPFETVSKENERRPKPRQRGQRKVKKTYCCYCC